MNLDNNIVVCVTMSKKCPDRFIPKRVVGVAQYERDLEWEEAILKMISESNRVSALNNSPLKTHHVQVSPTPSPPGVFEKPVLSSAEKEQQRREEERIKKGNIR